MESFGTIILIILSIAYVVLFCVPAFMFVWEGSQTIKDEKDSLAKSHYFSLRDGIGCYGWLCLLIGFAGTVIGVIAIIIRDRINE